jgi:hypothetical protein
MLAELGEGLKNILLAGVGAVAITAEKSAEIIDALVKKGELTVEQGKVLNEELKRNIKEKVKESVVEPADLIDRVDDLSPEDLAALKAKLAAMEEVKESADQQTGGGENSGEDAGKDG